MSDTDFGPELSPQAGALLSDLLQRMESSLLTDTSAPAVAEMVRYLCGVLPPPETNRIESRLVTIPASRKVLREVRTELLHLEVQTWAAVALAAQDNGRSAEVATVWLALTAEQVAAAQQAPALWLREGLEQIHLQAGAGIATAQTALNAFLAYSSHWNRPERGLAPAWTRGKATDIGEDREAIEMAEIAPCLAWITAAFDSTGTLTVILTLEADTGLPAAGFDGRAVRLSLRVGTELWPLAERPLTEGSAIWTIPEFGAVLQDSLDEIAAESLHVAFADSPASVSSFPATLRVEALDASGRQVSEAPTSLQFLEAPRWAGGEFFALVVLPPEMPLRYPGYSLRLDVAVTADHWQHLGAWTLVDGDNTPRTLQAACPGSLDAILSTVALLRAQIRPPA